MSSARRRIALNAQLLRLDGGYRSAGISSYSFNLLHALDRAADEFDFDVFCNEPRAPALFPYLNVHLTRFQTNRPLLRILWEQLIFPIHLALDHFDLLHSFAFVSPIAARVPSVVTVYDLSFILYPEYFRPLNRLYLTWGTRRAVRFARRIIAISASTRDDLVRLLNVSQDKIDVVIPGIEPNFFSNGDINAVERFRAAHDLPEHFVLYLGTLEPRKNIPALIKAFAQVKRTLHIPHRLVIAGARGWKDESIQSTIAEYELENEISLPGFVPTEELPYWYRAADAFVYPSQYEGFGLPPLEALASGTPVITSNVSALPEAVGDAAIKIDPTDSGELADALTRVLTDSGLRDDLHTRGPIQARKFTWERAADLTLQAYRRALGITGEAN